MNRETLARFSQLKVEGHKLLYLIKHGGLELIFRPLTFSEYKTIEELEAHVDPVIVNDTVVRVAVEYCSRGIEWLINDSPAILVDKVAEIIVSQSAFTDKKVFLELLTEARKKSENLESLIQIVIHKAFPSLTPDDVEAMTISEQMTLFAKAEQITGERVNIEAGVQTKEGKQPMMPPVPPGFETTDIMGQENADMPDWDKINKGAIAY